METSIRRTGKIDRFDGTMIAAILVLLVTISVVVARGDQLGVIVERFGPVDNASSHPLIQVTFDAPIDLPSVAPHFSIDPLVRGKFSVIGAKVIFEPTDPLQPQKIYTVTLNAGIAAATGRVLKQAIHWQFKVRAPQVVYLNANDNNLYTLDPQAPQSGQVPRKITDSKIGVATFNVLSDGSKIVYAEAVDQQTTRLFVLEINSGVSTLLYTCDQALCANPAWRPDGGAVAFDHVDLSGGQVLKTPHLWLFDLAASSAGPLFKDNQILAHNARWSPDGTLLAANDGTQKAIILHNMATGADTTIPLPTDRFGDFSPDGKWLYFPKIISSSSGTSTTHLVLIDLSVEPYTQRNLTPDSDPGNDIEAAWQADSQGLIVARRAPFSQDTTQGSQLYRVALDSGKATVLTSDATFRQLNLRVSPTNDAVLYRRLTPGKPAISAEVWRTTLANGESTRLAESGTDTRWLP